ncbi:dehydrogenase with different specificitie, partial [Trichodelitschia bisporula]
MALQASSLFRVDSCVALITGGGTGIGLMMARALAANGAAKVYIAGRRLEVLEKAAAETEPAGVVVPLVCDVASQESIVGMAEHIRSETGYLNLVVCNSGIGGPRHGNLPEGGGIADFQAQVLGTPMGEYTDTFAVNVTGAYYTAVAVLDLLDSGNKKGNMEGVRSQVLITSSIAAFSRAVGMGFAYGQSKAAVTHLTKGLASFLAPHGIRTNALAPGLFPSELADPLLRGRGIEGGGSVPHTFIPNGKVGDELDMGGTILYLASRAGAFVNGLILVIDGGRLAILPSSY